MIFNLKYKDQMINSIHRWCRIRRVAFIFALFLSFMFSQLTAQIVLMGNNDPHANVNDGDFKAVWDYWRNASQSPFWTTKPVTGDKAMGLHYGTLFSSNDEGVADSKILNTNPQYQVPRAGDVLQWSFGADLEYKSDGKISLSFVFGDTERILLQKASLLGGDTIVENFEGTYTITEEDAMAGLPFVRVRFYSEQDVKIYLHYVNIDVLDPHKSDILLSSETHDNGVMFQWEDLNSDKNKIYFIYRKHRDKGYVKIGESTDPHFLDSSLVHGIEYSYLITRFTGHESYPSNELSIQKLDELAPSRPMDVKAEPYDTEVKLTWEKNSEQDLAYYSIYRGDTNQNNYKMIGDKIEATTFEDILAPKEVESSYIVYAHDYSGNRSDASIVIKAKPKAVFGASFSDLIQPMPIISQLQEQLWGGPNVRPRDPENGIEDPDWSYWGGRPVMDKDEKYHMIVTRWPEHALKGHWEWPNSTVAHVVSERAIGPYQIEKELAYSYKNGLGHNPDIILLNDGTYALYSLIEWEPTIFTSISMSGPWKRQGILTVDMSSADPNDKRTYQYTRNLSGVQLDDGSILMVSKFGCMMISETGLLGPYKILSQTINHNGTIPDRYRNSNYEDPVMWRDEVQYHLIVNAFLDYRAIYLRSPDGIHWKYDPGLAYTPDFTSYIDGSKTRWYKLERPHVLQDEYGRATHLSVAVIDVAKADDYASDGHNSKNLILPLTKHKRIRILNKKRIDHDTGRIKLKLMSDDNFNPQTELDMQSLRLGAAEEVNLGGGCKALKIKNAGKDVIIEFDGSGNGIDEDDFVIKMLGRTKKGSLIVAYARLDAE